MKKALVCGAGGFIGGHLVKRLKQEGFWVRGVDLKFHEYAETEADDFVIGDLRDQDLCRAVIDTRFDEVYQLAADMGGAGYIFTGEHDADVMHNSATINLNVLDICYRRNIRTIFYSSSACMYPAYNQEDPDNPEMLGGVRLSGRAGQRIWLGEAVQRAAVSRLPAQLRHAGARRPLSQHLWPRRDLDGRAREGAGRTVPQDSHGPQRRRDRDLGRRQADAVVPVYRRVPGRDDASVAVGFLRSGEHRIRGDGVDRPACGHDC